ncbi:MAG: hypothetical protein WC453_01130 [Patescibacteria group bacterium]
MNGKTITEKIEWLLDLNKQHSDEFVRTRPSRQLYRVNHPTEIAAFKCMDGRIHIPLVTHTPLGILRPYRNIGGYFDLGWPLLGEDVKNWVDYGISKGRKSLIIVTYHYSKGDGHRGCAGFHYDRDAAFDFTVKFHNQVNRFFGHNNQVVFPIVMGLETDTDSLVFHPQDPKGSNIVYCSEKMSDKSDYLSGVINELYPDMDSVVRQDIIPLIHGNINHIREVRESNRDLTEMQHNEWVLGVGRGFDWLHEPNTALLVGPFDPDLSKPIITAISIIADNMKSGRISDDGFLVLSSAPFKQKGVDENRAKEKANFFRSYIKKILADNYPDLLGKAKFIAVTVDEHTRRIEQVPELD